MEAPQRSTPELDVLTGLFYDKVDDLGDFQEIGPNDLPDACRSLLANDRHMTVNLQGHHGSPVEVVVLDSTISETHYCRKIVLQRRQDGAAVLFGIVRLARSLLADDI